MPRQSRQSSKSNGERGEIKGCLVDPSPSGKRSIRWFVHSPTFSFSSNRATPSAQKSTSPAAVTTPGNDADKCEANLTPNTVTTASPTVPKHLSTKPSPLEALSLEYSEVVFSHVVHQLQRELEEAKEQIKVLEKVKELQAQETERIKREQQTIVSSEHFCSVLNGNVVWTNTCNGNLEVKTKVEDVDFDDDDSSTSSCSSESSAQHKTVAKHAAQGATCDLLEETDHPIIIDPDSVPIAGKDQILEGSVQDKNNDQRHPDQSCRPRTPSSMTGPLLWQALAFENVGGIDDENSMNQLDPVVPPIEVTTIRDPSPREINEHSPIGNMPQVLAVRLLDAHQRAHAYRNKLEASQDLVASLFRDLERARRSIQALVARNISLSRKVKSLKLEMDGQMVHRGSLVKACVYITPVFILCGGLEFFVSTIVLVWILVELEGSKYWDMDEDDDDDDLTNEEDALVKLQQTEFPRPIAKDMPIPRNIILSTTQ